jgi:PAS domain S-box-containing protein
VILREGVVTAANEAFLRTLALPPGGADGQRLEALLPPEAGAVPTPRPGATRSYRTRVAGLPARVDVAAAAPRADGLLLAMGVLTLASDTADTAADRALLELARALAEARAEQDVATAVARVLAVLFPGRDFAVRLFEPRTLALTAFHAQGRLRARARSRLALRREEAERAGVSAETLRAAGVVLVERDEPLFEGCERALSVGLGASGELAGLLSLEYGPGAPGAAEADEPVLRQVASHAALAVRNLRSLDEVLHLKAFLEELVEHAHALIWAVDRSRRITAWNAAVARLTGTPRAEVSGADALAVFAERERPRMADALSRVLAGEPCDLEVALQRRGGGEARAALSLAPVLSAAGDVEGVIATGQDLTLLRSLEAAAEHSERLAAVGRLVAGVVHELNNPLTAVTMYSDALVEKLSRGGGDPGDLEKLRAVKDAGLRIQRLARDLVAYARPTGARTEPVELDGVVDEGLRLAKAALKEAGAVLVREGGPAPVVEANRPSLVQVVLALVTNAAQAVAPGGRVEVAAAAGAGGAVLTVRDDGHGLDADTQARAFEPFFTTRPGLGIGLGLPIVRGIVERHGGEVKIESAPGRGTTVTVTLPVRPPSAPPLDSPTLPRPR